MQFCNVPGCGERVTRGRCWKHRPRLINPYTASAIVRAWYDSTKWQRLRDDVIRTQPFCVVCLEAGRKVLTAEIDHIRKHNCDPALFWDRANLQGLCKPCHGRKTARGE